MKVVGMKIILYWYEIHTVFLLCKVALDQVAYKNEARALKSVKIQTFSRCNEGTIVDGSVKNPNCTGCNVIEGTEIHETL